MIEEILTTHPFCISCMQEFSSPGRCPHCGYDERKYPCHPFYLKPKTVLKNQYFVGKALGQGGFGVTYLGMDQWLRKPVAIKEYLPSALATRDIRNAMVIPLKRQEVNFAQGLKLFINEARHLARFNHPHIVRVINFFEENQTGYMVMEHLEGSNPTEKMRHAGGRLSVTEALAILLPILDALAVVHAQHIYHRDISTQNIRILTDGTPVLIDFGAARHIIGENSRSLDLVLKHGYSPIEQYSGKGKIGPWTDIYACGALFYWMVTGELPLAATDRLNEDKLLPLHKINGLDIPVSLSQTIQRALALRAEERFQTVSDFKSALAGKMVAVTQPVRPTIPKTKSKILFFALISLLLLNIPANQGVRFQAEMITSNSRLTKNQFIEKVNHYKELAYTARSNGQLAESLAIVQQGLQHSPTNSELRALEQELIQQQRLQEQTQQITQLLNQGKQYLTLLQLESAYTTYQKILALETHHPEANKKLAEIAKKYEQLGQEQKNLTLVNQGLARFPNHIGLQSLQRQLNQHAKITELLKQAEQQLAHQQLIEPANNNAYQTYQQILTIAPDNAEAKKGFSRIADIYAQLATNERDHPQKSLEFIDKGLKVSPTHSKLIELSKKITEKMHVPATVVTTAQEVGLPVDLPEKIAEIQPVEKISSIEKTSPVPPPLNMAENLLVIAQQQLENGQLEAAHQIYKNVLTLEPENALAHTGLQQVAARWEQSARNLIQENRLSESLQVINKGLTFYPIHPTLLALQKEVTERLNSTRSNPSTPRPLFTPSF